MKKVFVTLALLSSLCACSSFHKQSFFTDLYKGMKTEDALKVTELKPTKNFVIEFSSATYKVYVFSMLATQTKETAAQPSEKKSGPSSENKDGVFEDYYLIFQSGQLYFYGNMYELNRHKDKVLNDLAVKIQKMTN